MMDKIVRPPSDWTFLENPKWATEKEPQEVLATAGKVGGTKDGTSLEEIMKEQEKGKKKRKKIE